MYVYEHSSPWECTHRVGRVCARLPSSLSDQVLDGVLALLGDCAAADSADSRDCDLDALALCDRCAELEAVDESVAHGVCLTLAELARRGLLLPARLPLGAAIAPDPTRCAVLCCAST